MHEIVSKKSFLGLEKNFCLEKEVITLVPEAPITLVYNAFVWKIQAQISVLPKSDQHFQPAAPHSSFMLAKQVIDYSPKKDINSSFTRHERRKKNRGRQGEVTSSS